MPVRLEVPIFGSDSAEAAKSAGASRLELNAEGSYPQGGLTPMLEECRDLRRIDMPLRIMIRPRGPPPPVNGADAPSPSKDFIYTGEELEAMEVSINEFKTWGLLKPDRGDGFVFGSLKEGAEGEGSGVVLDVETCKRFAEMAKPYKAVFHRAFDELVAAGHWQEALDELVACGFDGVLTSGGPGDAVDNVAGLDRILEAAGERIEIIVGGGVRSTNIGALSQDLQLGSRAQPSSWVHSSCLTKAGSEEVDDAEVSAILEALK